MGTTHATNVDALLAGLNDEQRAAVTSPVGPTAVIAGAGTGKTRVLTSRVAFLTLSNLLSPVRGLCVTFTNKAAEEMRHRLVALIGEDANLVSMGSFHAMSMAMLRHHAGQAGLKNERFIVLEDADQLRLLELVVKESGIAADYLKSATTDDATPVGLLRDLVRKMHFQILNWKEQGLTHQQVKGHGDSSESMLAAAAYPLYQKELLEQNACDFADLLLHMVVIFRASDQVRRQWAGTFDFIGVDEYQDVNDLQHEWLRHLGSDHRNIFGVGDWRQCIYRWRLARPEFLTRFDTYWPGARHFALKWNYRSGGQILDLSNKIVRPLLTADTLELDSMSGERGHVRCQAFHDAREEAASISTTVKSLLEHGHPAPEIAILGRTAFILRNIEEALVKNSIAYFMVGGPRFHDREEVKDLLAYLRLANNPSDVTAFLRIHNKPARKVGDASAERIAHIARSQGVPMHQACQILADSGGPGKTAIAALAALLAGLAQEGLTQFPGDIIETVLRRTSYLEWREGKGDLKTEERRAALRDLVKAANEYRSADDYLAAIAVLSTESRDRTDAIRLSTIHAAKGLEFDTVFTPGFEDGVIPNARAIREPDGMTEERCIAHVGWTRPRKVLAISYSGYRNEQVCKPSPFLKEVGLLKESTRPHAAGVSELPALPAATGPVLRSAGFLRRY